LEEWLSKFYQILETFLSSYALNVIYECETSKVLLQNCNLEYWFSAGSTCWKSW